MDINAIIITTFGLIIGSFLNVLILRMDSLKTVLTDRSRCPHCHKTLGWFDLVPVFSYLILQGKCRYCKKPISIQYPLVELATGLIFLLLFLKYGLTLTLLFVLITFSIMIILFVYDLLTQTVPEIFVWITLAFALATSVASGRQIVDILLGALIGGGFLALLVYGSRKTWMGEGDVKIGVILGVLTGFPNSILALFLAFIIGSIVGIIYLLTTRKKIDQSGLRQSLPFAPFLVIGMTVALFYGDQIVYWYLNLV